MESAPDGGNSVLQTQVQNFTGRGSTAECLRTVVQHTSAVSAPQNELLLCDPMGPWESKMLDLMRETLVSWVQEKENSSVWLVKQKLDS